MHRSRGRLSAALILSVLAGTVALAPTPAAAVTPPVAFTADDLPTWQTNGVVWALAETDDTVFVGGTFSQVRPPEGASGTPQNVTNFVSMNAATGAPASCSLSFSVGTGVATVRTLVLSPDKETLYAGGYFGAVNGTPVSSLAAIDVDTCTPIPAFNPSFPATVRALAVTDDTVYAAGDFGTVEGQTRQRFAAVDSTNGDLRPFTANADEPGRAIEVTPDGQRVLLGGDFFTVNGQNSHALAVVDATSGAVTRAYASGFIPTNSVVKDIDTDASGFYTGNEGTGGGVFDGRIALNLSDFNQRWRDTCLGATQAVESYQDVLYSASHAHDCSSVGEFPDGPRQHLLAQPVTSVGKLGWFPNTNSGIGEGIGPRALAISGTGTTRYLWVGGEFTTVNGDPGQGLTRFASGPDTGVPAVPQASAASTGPGAVQLRWRSSVDLDDSRLTYRVYRNGAATPVYTVDGDSLPWSRQQVSFRDTNISPGQTYSYRVTATDGAGNASGLSSTSTVTVPTSAEPYPSAVLDDGASLYWRYDDSAAPFTADSSSGDNSGVQVNAPALRQTPPAVGGSSTAIGLNGTNQQIHSARRTAAPGSFSVETWFRTTTTRGGKLIGFGNNTTRNSGNYDKHVYMTNNGQLVFGVNSGGPRTLASPSGYNNGAWHHVVASQGPSGMALYVDGVLIGSNNVTGNQQYDGYWRVGGDNLANWPSRPSSNFFAGQIDETAVYPSALTAQQVARHRTLASAPADTVTTITAVDDTYSNSAAAGTNYGTSGSLAVGGTAAYQSYLRFELPAAPAGTVLKSARLAVKTSTQSGAGSADSQSIVPVTGTWSETELTHNNRPALGSEPLGTLTGATEGSTVYSAPLDTAALSAAGAGSYSLALTGSGSDALWLWSSEAAAAEETPQLVLTFGAP
jgi:hypothetical protein